MACFSNRRSHCLDLDSPPPPAAPKIRTGPPAARSANPRPRTQLGGTAAVANGPDRENL